MMSHHQEISQYYPVAIMHHIFVFHAWTEWKPMLTLLANVDNINIVKAVCVQTTVYSSKVNIFASFLQ